MPAGMRVVSLVPSATEMLFALGLGESVVGVTHECDYPREARLLPSLTRTVVPDGLADAEIDAAVRSTLANGRALYELDEARLASLSPDLIVTQAVCGVCAVSHEDVLQVAASLPTRPAVVTQDPSTLAEVFEDLIRLGEATGIAGHAHELRGELEGRLASVRAAVSGADQPRVIALEWLSPPYIGGHWIPEMISIAGGEDVAGPPGLASAEVQWGELAGLNPDVVVAMPCGWYVEESSAHALAHWDEIASLGAKRVFAVDAASTFSRPGPRLVDGVELLGHLLHPDLVERPGTVGFMPLRSPASRS